MTGHEGECSFLAQPFDDDGNRQDRNHCRHCGKARAEVIPRTYTEWGVAYEGDEPGTLDGIREYDDREDAESIIAMGLGDVLVTRTVTATPWQRAEAEAAL